MKQGCSVVIKNRDEIYVYKHKDGRWEARYIKGYSTSGKAMWGYVYGKTREDAIQKRRIILDEKNGLLKKPKRLNLLILGAGSHGRNIKEIAETLRVFNKISFLDDNAKGEDIIGKCNDALEFQSEYSCAFVAMGDNKLRKKWTIFLKDRDFMIPSIIATSAIISPKAIIGEGVAIMPQCTVNESVIGDFCILASNSLISIDAKVGNFSRIDSGGIVLKGKTVPEATWVKSGEIFGNGKNIKYA